MIAGKAACFFEDLQPAFTEYSKQVIKNAAAMADEFNNSDTIKVVSGGTDNHLMVLDLTSTELNGKEAQILLDSLKITTNKEAIPDEKLSPFITSGLRLGTPAITSRGFDEKDSRKVAKMITRAIENHDDENVLNEVKEEVSQLTQSHPIFD